MPRHPTFMLRSRLRGHRHECRRPPRGHAGGQAASLLRRRTRILGVLVVALAAGLGSAAPAQVPPPFGPEPDFSGPAQCSRERVRLLARQLEALEKLRAAGPEAIGRVCALIGMGSAWLSREPDARGKLREFLGFDIDLELVESQCRAGQEHIARELAAMAARLRAELLRCDDTA